MPAARALEVKDAKTEIQKPGRWNLLDWQILVAELPKLEQVHASDDVLLAVASAHFGEVMVVTLVCPRLVRTWFRMKKLASMSPATGANVHQQVQREKKYIVDA